MTKATTFKTGTWATNTGVNYIFYSDGKGGKTVNVSDGMGVGFEYEIDEKGNCVFHMGGAEDNTRATVRFLDEENNTASIIWADGSKDVIMFVSADTSDEFAES